MWSKSLSTDAAKGRVEPAERGFVELAVRGFKGRKAKSVMASSSGKWWRGRVLVPAMIFFLALGTRLLFIAWRGPLVAPDSKGYLTLAQNIVGHGVFSLDVSAPFTPTINRPPLYPFFLAVFEWFGVSSLTVIAAVQALMDAGVAVAVLFLARSAGVGVSARGVATVYALYPGAIVSAAAILTETLFTSLLAVSSVLVVVGLQTNRAVFVMTAGVGLGFAALCRPVALLLPAALIGVLVFAREARCRWLFAIVLLAASSLTVLPWTIRSSLLAHRPVPVQAGSAVSFYMASRVDWDQKNEKLLVSQLVRDPVVGARMASASSPEEMAKVEVAAWRHGIRNIRGDVFGYVASRAATFPLLFLSSFDTLTGFNESLGSVIARRDLVRLVVKLTLLGVFSFVPILLAVAGLPGVGRRLSVWVSAVIWIYMLVVYSPLWIENRYWWPAVPFMLVSAAVGVERLENIWHRANASWKG